MNQKEGIKVLTKALEGLDKRYCPSGELHVFQMIKGSGKTGAQSENIFDVTRRSNLINFYICTMPVTSLEISQQDGTKKRLQFYTEQYPTGLFIRVRQCDEEWIPFGEPAETTDPRSEETYHKELRQAAMKKGQFVAQYSTNPEWNPGYIPPQDEDTL